MLRRCCLLGLCLLLAACASDPPTVTPPPPTAEGSGAAATVIPGAKALKVQVLNTELGTGFERIAFRLFDDTGAALTAGDVRVAFVTTDSKTGQRKELASGTSLYFGALMPDNGSWIAYTDFDASGPWTMDVTAKKSAGDWTGQTQVTLNVVGRTRAPRMGPPPPEKDTPKLAKGGDPATITSESDPDPEMYEQSVADAIAARQPAVVYFGSYAHCATPICRATLAEIRAIKNDVRYKGKVTFIAIESRDLKDPTQLSAAAKAWGLPSEPWTFILSKNGGVSVRIEGGLEKTELGLLLDRELAAGRG